MKRSDNLRWSQVKAGIFILVAILLFGAGVLMMGDKTKMFIQKGTLSVIMPDVAGLKIGAPVWLAGVDVGLVTDIHFETPEKNNEITVTLQIDRNALKKIGTDSKVIIKTRGLMGEKYVDITPSLKYSESPPERIYGENVARLDDVMQKAGASFDRLNSILEKVDRGEGTLGKLTTDKRLYENLAALSLELKQLADSVNSGEGSIGKLIRSDEPYNKVVSILNRVDATFADIQSKDGTLGRLIRDREMYDKGLALVSRADSAVKSFEDVAARLHTKEGSAGKLLNDQEAYDKLVKMIESIDALILDIKANPKKYINLSVF